MTTPHHDQEQAFDPQSLTPEERRDAELTAYALGELDPASDAHAAVEAQLSHDPAAQAEANAIRAAADQLAAALHAEPLPAPPPPTLTARWPRYALWGTSLAAASIAVALLLPALSASRSTNNKTNPHHRDLAVVEDQSLLDPRLAEAKQSVAANYVSEAAEARKRGYDGLAYTLLTKAYELDPTNPDIEAERAQLPKPEALASRPQLMSEVDRYRIVRESTGTTHNKSAVIAGDKIVLDSYAGSQVPLTPYQDITTYPEDWPELTSSQLSSVPPPGGSTPGSTPDTTNLRSLYLSESSSSKIFNQEGVELDKEELLRAVSRQKRLLAAKGVAENFEQLEELTAYGEHLQKLIAQENPRRPSTEAYDRVEDNPFLAAMDNPLSTFSIDVDTASYANVRRFLNSGSLPPAGAVRIEEMVNYFDYRYAPPGLTPVFYDGPQFDLEDLREKNKPAPFAAHLDVANAPWSTAGHKLVRIGLKGKQIATDDRPAANLVFLLDVSGSMSNANKLPLVKAGMKKLVGALRMDDRVAIVVYAGASGLVLDSTSDHDAVLAAIDNLTPGGSTNGAAGIELAYQQAVNNHIPGGLNRVILCTDGDFNVGITDRDSLTRLIEDKANHPGAPTYLTVLGFGMGNLKDATMEELSNAGDGNYGYVDSLREAEKLLAEQVNATLLTIAKDVKIQVEFNPAKVASYRLIGYENRLLAKEDFNNDVVDAGDIGAGHTVTALYEVVPVDGKQPTPDEPERQRVDDLKYQQPAQLAETADSDELLTLKLRYKEPDAPKEQGTSKLLTFPLQDASQAFEEADEDFRFAASVAGFGMLLRGSPYAGDLDYNDVAAMAAGSAESWIGRLGELTPDQQRRQEFIQLVIRAAAFASPGHDATPATEPSE